VERSGAGTADNAPFSALYSEISATTRPVCSLSARWATSACHHTDELAVLLDHRKPAHLVSGHQLQRLVEILLRVDGDEIRGRDLAKNPSSLSLGFVTLAPSEAAETIRSLALSLPESYEDEPWGHPVFKVGENRMFASMSEEDDCVHLTVKLTAEEREIAHLLPFVRKARYVGRYGWITAEVTDEESLEAALEWVRESYWLKAPAEIRDAARR